MSEVRRCTKCGNEYPLTPEWWHRKGDGFRPDCKNCKAQNARRYRVENRDKVAEKDRRYYAENRDKVAEKNRRYYAENRDRLIESSHHYRAENINEVLERNRQYYAENRDRVTRCKRQYYAENRDRVTEARRQYYAKNRDRVTEHKRQYRAENRDKARVHGHNRRARKRSLPTLWSADLLRSMFSAWDHRCAYCGNQQGLFEEMKMSADHFIPLIDKDNCPGTVPWNMIPACKSCNCSKNASDPHTWLITTFGKTEARRIEARIADYFTDMKRLYSQEASA